MPGFFKLLLSLTQCVCVRACVCVRGCMCVCVLPRLLLTSGMI